MRLFARGVVYVVVSFVHRFVVAFPTRGFGSGADAGGV